MSKSTYLSDKELSHIKKQLKKEKKEVSEELTSIRSLIKDQKAYISRSDMNYDSDASKIRNLEMLKSMRDRLKARSMKQKEALSRIKEGTYGICKVTGKKISKERLAVMPEADTSIKLFKKK